MPDCGGWPSNISRDSVCPGPHGVHPSLALVFARKLLGSWVLCLSVLILNPSLFLSREFLAFTCSLVWSWGSSFSCSYVWFPSQSQRKSHNLSVQSLPLIFRESYYSLLGVTRIASTQEIKKVPMIPLSLPPPLSQSLDLFQTGKKISPRQTQGRWGRACYVQPNEQRHSHFSFLHLIVIDCALPLLSSSLFPAPADDDSAWGFVWSNQERTLRQIVERGNCWLSWWRISKRRSIEERGDCCETGGSTRDLPRTLC